MTKTKIVGILNITPDSFSGDGFDESIDNALFSASKMLQAGADVIDVGAESTRPNAAILSHEDEWRRLGHVLAPLKAMLAGTKTLLSIDTYHVQTAEKAIAFGVDWINDVSGLSNNMMLDTVARSNVRIVLMHNLGIPANPKVTLSLSDNPVKMVKKWANDKIIQLTEHGIRKERIIFDPGLGFGKTAEQSLILVKNIDNFADLGVEILTGHSRKSFLTLFTKLPAASRDIETYITSCYLAGKKVDYLRVHDVAGNKRALAIAHNLYNHN
jgi:dihydropteroate synthase